MGDTAGIEVVIVAGGLGTRMGPATMDLPKPMLAVAGKPVLEHQLAWLKGQGFSQVTLCLGYKAELVRAHFGDGSRWGVGLRYAVETSPRGTAGCVRDLRSTVDLLVVYGDLFPDLKLEPLLDLHVRRAEAAATLALLRSDHPRDSDLATVEGWRITRIYRDPDGLHGGNLGLAAVWIVRPSLTALIAADKPSDFGLDVFPAALRQGLPLAGCVMQGMLADLGTPERLERFNAQRLP